MLARLVSDRQMDPTEPIFMDRNEATFGFVLDYLRYGRITLPMTVSREIFLLGMDFYGIAHEVGTTVKHPPMNGPFEFRIALMT